MRLQGTTVSTTERNLNGLIKLLDQLGEPAKTVVELRLWPMMSFDQIAKEMGWKSHTTAMYHYKKALKQLREMLNDTANRQS
jgi:DNA-directed RNA polymerase specialized sigma24 family protein